MTLGEKINFFRKERKLSQEELAARVGVSRQAVSKWELGDAAPELDKLVALARAFGVTTDQLLSPEPPMEPKQGPAAEAPSDTPKVFSRLGRMVRRHGWLAGLYIALEGLAILAFGLLFLFFIRRMFPAAMLPADPMRFFTGFITMILVVAGCQALFGAVLALVLWKRGRKN